METLGTHLWGPHDFLFHLKTNPTKVPSKEDTPKWGRSPPQKKRQRAVVVGAGLNLPEKILSNQARPNGIVNILGSPVVPFKWTTAKGYPYSILSTGGPSILRLSDAR